MDGFGNIEISVSEISSMLESAPASNATLAKLRAAVTKGSDEKNSERSVEHKSESERPKFGISSLISRMSRSEVSSSGLGDKKEPNFNSDEIGQSDVNDLERDKIEVPAFLRRQAN